MVGIFEKYKISTLLLLALGVEIILPKTPTQIAITYLLFLMILDFLTGILASYHTKENKIDCERYRSKNKYINSVLYILNNGILYNIRNFWYKLTQVITKQKIKRTGIKVLLYFSTILVTSFFEQIFFIKEFDLKFSELKFSLTLFIILFWSLIEWYSIFFENFKNMGFDVISSIKKVIKKILEIKTEIDKVK